MKRYIGNITKVALLAFTALLVGCGSEDTPTVEYKNPSSVFMPADDDTSFEASLRTSFFNNTGIYLLFNDTLQHVYQGTDVNDEPSYFTELLDMTYNVGTTSPSDYTYTYTYLQTDEQKQMAVDFVNEYVLNHFTNNLKPYSFFISNVITGSSSTYTSKTRPYALSNERCVAIALNYLLIANRSETQKLNYAQRVLNTMIGQMANNKGSAFSEFYAYSSQYYSASYPDGVSGTTADLRSRGFISAGSTPGSFPTQTIDLNAYTLQAIQYSDEQLEKSYGDYDIVMNKFKVVKAVLTSLGYIF